MAKLCELNFLTDNGDECEYFLKINEKYPEGVFMSYSGIEKDLPICLDKMINLTLLARYLSSGDLSLIMEIVHQKPAKYEDMKCPICFEECSHSVFKCGHPYDYACYDEVINFCPHCREEEKDLITTRIIIDKIALFDDGEESSLYSFRISDKWSKMARELWTCFS